MIMIKLKIYKNRFFYSINETFYKNFVFFKTAFKALKLTKLNF